MSNTNNIISINPYNDKYSSLIRYIQIFLPCHDKSLDEKTEEFVGRERLMEKLYNWLSNPNKTC